jgi:hypothetical protein
MVAAKLHRHSHTKHVDFTNKPVAYVKYKCDELNHFQSDLTSFIRCENGNVCGASYKVGGHAVHCGEAGMSTGSLISPCAGDTVQCAHGDNHLITVVIIRNLPPTV